MTFPKSCVVLAIACVCLPEGTTFAQQPRDPEKLYVDTDWVRRLETGLIWGTLYVGITGESSKQTFKTVRAEVGTMIDIFTRDSPSLTGWTQTASTPARSLSWQLVGAIDYANFDGFSDTSLMGGLRVLPRPRAKFWAYGELLAGVQRSFGEGGLAIAPSAGFIMPVNQLFLTIGAGVIHASYEFDSQTAFRGLVGLTFPLGQRAP